MHDVVHERRSIIVYVSGIHVTWQVPPPRPDKHHRCFIIQLVHLVSRHILVANHTVDCVAEVDVAVHRVRPYRGEGVLKVSLH